MGFQIPISHPNARTDRRPRQLQYSRDNHNAHGRSFERYSPLLFALRMQESRYPLRRSRLQQRGSPSSGRRAGIPLGIWQN